MRRQQRRAELEAKKRDREEEKAAEREQDMGRKEEVTVGGCLHYSPFISVSYKIILSYKIPLAPTIKLGPPNVFGFRLITDFFVNSIQIFSLK